MNQCTAKIVLHERDLGIDTVATGKRNDTILKERTVNATGRAGENLFVVNTMATSGAGVKYVKQAQMMARQSMHPSQAYGNSAIGASPSITSKQKSNLATASGIMGKGSSRTLTIQWTFGPDAQPDINNPMEVIEAWLRFVDSEEIPHRALTKAWRLCYADIHHSATGMARSHVCHDSNHIPSDPVAHQACWTLFVV